jgi:hypothetical protein
MSPVVATRSRFMFWSSGFFRGNILSKFYPEDGNSTFLLNAGEPDYTASCPRRYFSSKPHTVAFVASNGTSTVVLFIA